MSTVVVRPRDPELQAAVNLAAAFATFTFLFHWAANLYQAHIGWGYFRDEFYYLMCGRLLAWGYVDHGPLVAVQARLAETLFGRSLAAIRALSALGGTGRVLLTGLLAWSMGGKRAAQALAMLAVSIAPLYLVLDGFLSMNSWESVFWMTCVLALILMERGGSERLWLWFGVSAGLGLLNKPSMTFFLAALLAELLLSPQRKLLWSRWAIAGIGVMLLLTLPNLLWQAEHHWPTIEFLRSNQTVHAGDRPGPLGLLKSQWLGLHPLGVLVWFPGLVWLLRGKTWRWLGLTYLIFFAVMMLLHSKDYYPTPIYPLLFAAGGIAWESRLAPTARLRLIGFPVLEGALLLTGILLLPISTPLMRPAQWVAYADRLHLREKTGNDAVDGPMPQYLADRFGWQEEVDIVTHAVASLSPEDRANARILCSNYGEAAALKFLGRHLPPVISGHNNYWIWGPEGATGDVMIVINEASLEEMRKVYQEVQVIGRRSNPYSMAHERHNIYLARGRKKNLSGDWAELKHYD